jgi:WD40 repeat protein
MDIRWLPHQQTTKSESMMYNRGSLIHMMEAHMDWVQAVAFSADSLWLASGSGDRNVHLWDPQTGKHLAEPFKGHLNDINSVAFSPDGKCISIPTKFLL